MHLSSLLEIAAGAMGDRVVVACEDGNLTYEGLLARAAAASRHLSSRGAGRLVSVDVNSQAVPVGLFAAALAGIPYVPVNYRLADGQLVAILERAAPGLAVVEASVPARLGDGIAGLATIGRAEFLTCDGPEPTSPGAADLEDTAVLLFTSGTTGEPKAAVLRHRHLTSYVLETVEFMGADPEDAALVSVPPYHIAGIAAVMTSVWSGRRLVYLPQFSAESWVDLAAAEAITHAMVVPTMLGRILEVLIERGETLPALRHLSYGGGRMPITLVERALEQLPHVGLVNAYGLTETSSTIAVLGPDDHREAIASAAPEVRIRLGSVGRPLPNLEVEIRDPLGVALPPGTHGEIWVRGEQVSGEYEGRRPTLSADGWLATNDGGWLDSEGYLFVDGRLDDVIVRGGENLSPGEIEDVLLQHPTVADCAVIGIPDDQWGEAVGAVVVLADGEECDAGALRAWVAERLRSTRAPEYIEFRAELPYSETGKLLRRVLKAELRSGSTTSQDSVSGTAPVAPSILEPADLIDKATLQSGRPQRGRGPTQVSGSYRANETGGSHSKGEKLVGPLSGVRVLDVTRFPPGGYCTVLLADLGAEVCRVDVPGANLRLNGVGVGLSRAKRSLALNFRHERAMEVLRRVTDWADVLVENNPPGDLERRGFGYRQASQEYPRLVWCAITGFGQDGPYAAWPGHDLTYTAQAGLLTAINAELPWHPETTLSLPVGALLAATGIVSALFDRQRSSRGCFIDISLAEAATWVLSGNDAALTTDARGLPATPERRLYECEDGRFVSVAAPEPRAWAALCKGVGLEDLAADAPPLREPADVEARLSAAFASRPASEWVEMLGPRGAAIGPVNQGADVLHDEQVKARCGVVEVEGVPLPANPIRLRDVSGTLATTTNTTPPPPIGADTESMLAAVGYSPDEIDQLRVAGVVG